jgi:DNA-binding beta-propeller fold protein YncE
MKRTLALGLVLMGAALSALSAGAEYKVLKRATLGGEGGWDLLTVDPGGRHLYVSRGTRVMVVDADTLEPVGEIAGTNGVHGIAVAAGEGRGYTTNGRANASTIFDLKTLKPVGEAKTGENPDEVHYDPATHRVFAFNGRSGDVTVIDAKDGKVAGTIVLGGKPELAASDGKGTVFVNLEDKGEIVALDARDLKVKARWPLAPCQEPTGLALDAAHRRLFAACGNKMMAVVDADSGKVVTTVPIGEGPDGAAFDAERGLVFIPNGRDGTLTIVREVSPDKYEVAQTVETARSARTLALDPKSHNVYLVAAQFGAAPSPTTEQPRPRPAMVPGSFEVLVVGR